MLSTSAFLAATMSNHIQIPVLKEGSYDTENWSDRTLTIDVATETATLSRHNHPKDLYHHSMRVLGVQKWPHVCKGQTGHGHDSHEAKRTLNLIGVKVPVQKFDGDDKKSNTSTGTGACTPGTGSATPSSDPNGDVDDSWMIRCTSQESYDAAVKLLDAIVLAQHARRSPQPSHERSSHPPPMPAAAVGGSVQSIVAEPVL